LVTEKDLKPSVFLSGREDLTGQWNENTVEIDYLIDVLKEIIKAQFITR
jgi:hypothetical protein